MRDKLIDILNESFEKQYDKNLVISAYFTAKDLIKSIEELHSRTNVPFVGSVPDYEAAKRSIIRGISKMLEPYIVFKEKPGYYADSVLHGCLTVVTPGEDR